MKGRKKTNTIGKNAKIGNKMKTYKEGKRKKKKKEKLLENKVKNCERMKGI